MTTKSNPDRLLIQRFLAEGKTLAMDSNPLAVDLGTHLEAVDGVSGTVQLSFTPSERFLQGNGVIQGGIVATMLDFAMAFAVLAKLPEDRSAATASMNIHLMKPALPGTYCALGRVQRAGAKLAFAEAELLRVEDGSLVASATSILPVLG